jgi:phage gp36-like protein
MAWVIITADDVKTRLSGPEHSALTTAALAAGQSNPLPDLISQTVAEIRGYVAACERNRLEEGEKIPSKLVGAALALIRYHLATRLPVKGLLTDERKQEYTDAIRLLERVADCKFAVEEPSEVSTEVISSPKPSVGTRTRNYDRASQDGI